jgi:hypothetical protein
VTASTVSAAAALVARLAEAFPGRAVHVVADAHYHGPALRGLPPDVTWTTRLPTNAVLYGLAPSRVRKPGRCPRRGAPAGHSRRPGRHRVLNPGHGADLRPGPG